MTPVVAGFGEETTTQLVDLTKTMRAGALLLVSKLLPQLVNQDVSQPADSGFFEVVLRTRCKMAWGSTRPVIVLRRTSHSPDNDMASSSLLYNGTFAQHQGGVAEASPSAGTLRW